MKAEKVLIPKAFEPVALILEDQWEVNVIAVLLDNPEIRMQFSMCTFVNPLVKFVDAQTIPLVAKLDKILKTSKGIV